MFVLLLLLTVYPPSKYRVAMRLGFLSESTVVKAMPSIGLRRHPQFRGGGGAELARNRKGVEFFWQKMF